MLRLWATSSARHSPISRTSGELELTLSAFFLFHHKAFLSLPMENLRAGHFLFLFCFPALLVYPLTFCPVSKSLSRTENKAQACVPAPRSWLSNWKRKDPAGPARSCLHACGLRQWLPSIPESLPHLKKKKAHGEGCRNPEGSVGS